MLWIEKYRPATFDAIVGQDAIVSRMRSFASTRTVPHMVLSGPHGTGKSSAVECLARGLYGETALENTTIIPTDELFSRGKAFLESDPRYSHIFRRDQGLLSNIKGVIRWYAALRPLDADFRLMVFEESQSLSREVQHALRRTMERFSPTSRFILITTSPAALIPAISSRCMPLAFAPISSDQITLALSATLAQERGVDQACGTDLCELIANAAHGDLRRAIMLLQVVEQIGEPFDLTRTAQTETGMMASSAFGAIRQGDIVTAQRRLESLISEYGMNAREVIRELRGVMRREWSDPRIAVMLGDTDHLIGHCNNEYIQLNALAVRIQTEVFHDACRGQGPTAL